MSMKARQAAAKGFAQADRSWTFLDGSSRAAVILNSVVIGRGEYLPGWKWSLHVAPGAGTELCGVEHVGLVLSGRAVAAMSTGDVIELNPGSLFHIPADPHDSWVVGDEPYVSLHFLGADHYAR